MTIVSIDRSTPLGIRDRRHQSRATELERIQESPIEYTKINDPDVSRVTTQFKTTTTIVDDHFIPHTDLVSTTNTEYLCDDYLKLRVIVGVYSTPLLHLTPAWQDPLISIQSGAQFTLPGYSKQKQFNSIYNSPEFTTSPNGYRFGLAMCANHTSDGETRYMYLSIVAFIVEGQHNDHLQWPFTGTIIIEFLNWLEDKEHYKKTILIDANKNFDRATKGFVGNVTCD